MNRILVMSDIHMEFGARFDCPTNTRCTGAIFAGDIDKPVTGALEWLAWQRDKFLGGVPIIYVAGNHEYYGSNIALEREAGRVRAEKLGIHFLDPGSVVIDGLRVIGATLWTDFNLNRRPVTDRKAALRGMNDYRRIKVTIDGKTRTVRPHYIQGLHKVDRAFIEGELAIPHDGPTIVVTHHAPHPESVVPMYRGEPLSACYASDLSEVIEKYQPKVWIHGHDHHHHLYKVGETTIFANPAGYPVAHHGARAGERECKEFNPRYIVEV